MNTTKMISDKQAGKSHTAEEIKSFIHEYARGNVPESAISAWLMAIYFKGMNDDETIAVLDAMITSGDRLDFSHLSNFAADKHSTGGVGDKVSIILGPLMASAGLAIPMLSGRSLGHTGGTLDKLESIPGYRTDLSLNEFRNLVETVGISMIGQTEEICPADKKMYALRDATSTVRSIPLIVGSIMSKKIAEGIQGLVLDIKVGNGAFMQTDKEARLLADKLIIAGTHFDISTEAVFSDMNQPLGNSAGLWCEINESIQALHGNGSDDLMAVTYKLGNSLLLQAGIVKTDEEAQKLQEQLISNGKAFQKFVEMVKAHGGDTTFIENPNKYEKPLHIQEFIATKSGYITTMNTLKLGLLVNGLTIIHKNNNRFKDNSGGIRFYERIGSSVQPGDVIATCFGNDKSKIQYVISKLNETISIGKAPVQSPPLFY